MKIEIKRHDVPFLFELEIGYPASLSSSYLMAFSKHQNKKPYLFKVVEGHRTWAHFFLEDSSDGILDASPPYGYSSIICDSDDDSFIRSAWEKYVQTMTDEGYLAEFFSFHPLSEPKYFPGNCWFNRQTCIVDFKKSTFFSNRFKRSLKKSDHNLQFFILQDKEFIVKNFPIIYKQGMQQIQANEFYFFDKSIFEDLIDSSDVYQAYCLFNGEICSSALFLKSKNIVEYFLGATNDVGRAKKASFLLFAESINFFRSLGVDFLYFGGGSTTDKEDSLLEFKKGFSNEFLDYKIGGLVFDNEKYLKLKQQQSISQTNKVLFYR